MKKILIAGLLGLGLFNLTSCSDNKAAENKKPQTALQKIEAARKTKSTAPVKGDGTAIAQTQTEGFVLKLHRAFAYEPKGSDVLKGMKAKPGFKFIYLDVSLRNTGTAKLDGGFLMLGLKVTGADNIEYKKPAAALAAYTSERPEEANGEEYDALWETFRPGEFHREVVWAVEVPAGETKFTLHVPEAPQSRVRRQIVFEVQ